MSMNADGKVELPFRVIVTESGTILRVETRVFAGDIVAGGMSKIEQTFQDGDFGTMLFTIEGNSKVFALREAVAKAQQDAIALCHAIEQIGASTEQTNASILASNLQSSLGELLK